MVDWNGGARATTFKSATSLPAAIQASDIATAGTAEITVVSFGANGGVATSAPLAFTINPSSMSAAQFPQVISVSAAGGPANGPSEAPAISADGRYVAFYSQAKNLITLPAAGNIFVRDTCLGATNCTPKTVAVDVAPDGSAPNGKTSRQVAISGDGRFVASFRERRIYLTGMPWCHSDTGNCTSATSASARTRLPDACRTPKLSRSRGRSRRNAP